MYFYYLIDWNGVGRWKIIMLIFIFITFNFIIYNILTLKKNCILLGIINGCCINPSNCSFYIIQNSNYKPYGFIDSCTKYDYNIYYRNILHFFIFTLIGSFYNLYICVFYSILSSLYDYYSYGCKNIIEVVIDLISFFISNSLAYLLKK